MNGKSKCRILKEIRARIAAENDIPYVTSQCRHQGDCAGTCPKCEEELRDLEQQLEKRKQLGKAVTVSALALSLTAAAAGCVPLTSDPDISAAPPASQSEMPVKGELTVEPATTPTGELCESQTEVEVLMGDIAELPPTETELAGDLVVGELPGAGE